MRSLAEIGRLMVESDNQATAFPVFLVSRGSSDPFPRVFLSEAEAEEFVEEEGGSIRVGSSKGLRPVMLACLEAAGLLDHPQAKNAYFTGALSVVADNIK